MTPAADLATTVLPDQDELLRRLTTVDNEPHLIEQFYPRITKAARREVTGMGIVLMLHLAVSDYTTGMPMYMATVMLMRLEAFTRALVDDEQVLADAMDTLRTLGLA